MINDSLPLPISTIVTVKTAKMLNVKLTVVSAGVPMLVWVRERWPWRGQQRLWSSSALGRDSSAGRSDCPRPWWTHCECAAARHCWVSVLIFGHLLYNGFSPSITWEIPLLQLVPVMSGCFSMLLSPGSRAPSLNLDSAIWFPSTFKNPFRPRTHVGLRLVAVSWTIIKDSPFVLDHHYSLMKVPASLQFYLPIVLVSRPWVSHLLLMLLSAHFNPDRYLTMVTGLLSLEFEMTLRRMCNFVILSVTVAFAKWDRNRGVLECCETGKHESLWNNVLHLHP